MATMKELVDMFVGRAGQLEVSKMAINVTVQDVRLRYGKLDFLVTPVAGIGKEWVSESRVSFGPGQEVAEQ